MAKLMNRNVDAVWIITQALDDALEHAERALEKANERASQWADIAGGHGAEVDRLRTRLAEAEQRGRARDWKWICEFCYARLYVNTLPKSWEFIWQSAVCPECRLRVEQDGGYAVVKGGAYNEVPDPRALVTPHRIDAL